MYEISENTANKIGIEDFLVPQPGSELVGSCIYLLEDTTCESMNHTHKAKRK